MQALVTKYGPEPATGQASQPPAAVAAPAAAPSPQAAPAAVDYRTRITAMYAKYQPEKVAQVDAMLEKYKGAEDQLMQALVTKYGPEPPAALATPPSSLPVAAPPRPKAVLPDLTGYVSRLSDTFVAESENLLLECAAEVFLLLAAACVADGLMSFATGAASILESANERWLRELQGCYAHPGFPFVSERPRAALAAFFGLLSVTGRSESPDGPVVPVLEVDSAALLLSALGIQPELADSRLSAFCSRGITFEAFRRILTPLLPSTEEAAVAAMRGFTDAQQEPTAAGPSTSPAAQRRAASPRARAVRQMELTALNLGRGVWAHVCVFPSVMEQWSRVWLRITDRVLTWQLPNATSHSGSVPLAVVEACYLMSMLTTRAPRTFAKNGVELLLSGVHFDRSGPVHLAICPEQMIVSQALVTSIRSGMEARRGTVAAVDAPSKSPALTTGALPASTTVYSLRAGQQAWVKNHWYVVGDRILFSSTPVLAADASLCAYWSVSRITSVSPDSHDGFAALQPPLSRVSPLCCFSVSVEDPKGGGAMTDLFCICERPHDRETLLNQIRVALIKAKILNTSSMSPQRQLSEVVARQRLPGSPTIVASPSSSRKANASRTTEKAVSPSPLKFSPATHRSR